METHLSSKKLFVAMMMIKKGCPRIFGKQFLGATPSRCTIRYGSTTTSSSSSAVHVSANSNISNKSNGQHLQDKSSLSSAPKVANSTNLAILPFTSVLRSYLITTVSSSPILLSSTMFFMQRMLHSSSILFSIDRNQPLQWILKKTFYAQFCAGSNETEVKQSTNQLRAMGYSGIILEYADEVLEGDKRSESFKQGIETWRNNLLQSISMCQPGDFVGLKWSGMGSKALELLKAGKEPLPEMEKAMIDVCDAAAQKKIFLLPAAEPQNANATVDAWSLKMAEKYNTDHAIVYNTYQCYLKITPTNLIRHLKYASDKNFVLGVKLVRGAYLETEVRNLIWDTKEETDDAYNEIAEGLLKREYNKVLHLAKTSSKVEVPPRVDLVLATHNQESVLKARAIRDEQVEKSLERITLSFAQLYGMADEVSLALVQTRKERLEANTDGIDVPKVFKCLAYGTMKQCLHYLVRRAEENKDAISRTKTTRDAMRQEVWRRMKNVVLFRS